MTVAWTDFLLPWVESITVDPHEDHLKTDFEYGPARLRRRFSAPLSRVKVSWVFTKAEYAIFRSVYQGELNYGINWFTMPVYEDTQYTTYTTRFVGKYSATANNAGTWTVSGELEVRDMQVMSGAAAYLLGFLGEAGALDFMDKLQILVNTDYPHSLRGLP